MPYFNCPSCDLTLYGEAAATRYEPCPECGAQLVSIDRQVPTNSSDSIFRDRRVRYGAAPITELLDLQERIAKRLARGGSLAAVERDIIATSSADEEQRGALRLYAKKQLQAPEREGVVPFPFERQA